MFRLTFAFNRDEINTVLFPASDVQDALKKAFVYIESEYGEGKFEELVAISLLQHVEQEETECEQE
jgi:hypothetical protein